MELFSISGALRGPIQLFKRGVVAHTPLQPATTVTVKSSPQRTGPDIYTYIYIYIYIYIFFFFFNFE
jgi:hypothetical protein